jgi:hypothetical protein
MGSAAPDTARLIKEQEAELIKKIENEIETLKKTQ